MDERKRSSGRWKEVEEDERGVKEDVREQKGKRWRREKTRKIAGDRECEEPYNYILLLE